VPFCFHKCHYCDFYSIVDNRDRQEVFTQRLIRELRALAPFAARPLRTIFVGGGTPSLLRVDLWQQLLEVLDGEFEMSLMQLMDHSGKTAEAGEFTVECNPETVSQELMDMLRQGGVTRVSIGAQTFHAQHLKTLERWHDPANVARAVELARAAGITRQSLDLIYAIPGQTIAELDHDLDAALALKTEHLSCYTLTYEVNTAMTARLRKGEFLRADEDLEADMFEHVLARLRGAGLDRYEVSNFARANGECRHNLAYWRQDAWLAAGPSASAHVAGRRWKNVQRLDDYLQREQDGFASITDFEGEDRLRNLGEWLWTGLRTRDGIDEQRAMDWAAQPEIRKLEHLRACVRRQREAGNLRVEETGRWQLTDQGFMVADRVSVEFLHALDA